MKKQAQAKLPYMPFYIGDWFKAPEVRALPLDVRMMWFEMLCFMWESSERGYLTINGNPIDMPILANMLSVTEERLTLGLTLMDNLKVYSKRESDGAIFSRKMVRDEETRKKRAIGGFKGGNPALKDNLKVNHKGYPSLENEICIPLDLACSSEEGSGEKQLTPPEPETAWPLWDDFCRAYPNNGSTLDPGAERTFLRLVAEGESPAAIVAGAKAYQAYMRAKHPDTYPHCGYMAQAVNWLAKKQYVISWVEKQAAEERERTRQARGGRMVLKSEEGIEEKYAQFRSSD